MFEVEPGEPPGLRPAFERHDRVRDPGGQKRLRANDAAGPPGAGDDDQRVGLRHEVGNAQHQLGARAGDRPRYVKPGVFVERAAVEHDDLLAGLAPPVELGGGDRWRPVIMLDDLGKRLARHVAAREERVMRTPGGDPALEEMDLAIAEPGQPARRPVGYTVAIIDQHHPA